MRARRAPIDGFIVVIDDFIWGVTMKKLGRIAFLVVLILILSLGLFVACNDKDQNKNDNNDDVIPTRRPCVDFVIDGVVYMSKETDVNGQVTIPTRLTKDGFEFVGWFLDNGSWQKPFTEDTLRYNPVKNDTRVYAYFKKNHQHTFEKKWTYSNTYHWHKSDCGHNLFADQAKHTFDEDGVCTVCGYEYAELSGAELKTKTLTLDGYNISGKVSNTTTRFSFADEITIADGASYVISTDENGLQTIEGNTVDLEEGDNCFYILVQNKKVIEQYKVVIRRRPRYMVTFDTSGGTGIVRQYVEEDGFVSVPSTTKTGYRLASWSYDFSQPITKNEHIVASWEIEHYTIEYIWNGGEVNQDNPTSYTVNDEITLPAPIKVGYTGSWDNGGKIEKGSTGNKTFTAQYTINKYNVTIEPSIENSAIISGNGVYDYDTVVTASVSYVFVGYEFIGFYDGDTCLTTEKTYTFNVPTSDVVIVAKFAVKEEFQDFTFTSHSQACTITGVKDKTIEKVVIPDMVDIIGPNAFEDCVNLTSIYVPRSVRYIEAFAFKGCSGLATVILCDGLKEIAYGAFYQCVKLTQIDVPSTVTKIGHNAFNECSELTAVKLREGLTTIEFGAFSGCAKLTSIDVPSTVTVINSSTFSKCSELETVTLHEGLLTIDRSAFYGCKKLTNIVIPDTVTKIGQNAFLSCSNLTSVKIGNDVTELGTYAFGRCSSLTDVTIGIGVTNIANRVFYDCPLTSVKYAGTMAQWAEVTIGTNWGATITQIICTDGTITLGTTEE